MTRRRRNARARAGIAVAAIATALGLTYAAFGAANPGWAIGVVVRSGWGGTEATVYADSDLRLGVVEDTWPLKGSLCATAYLNPSNAQSIYELVLRLSDRIPNRSLTYIQSDCKDDRRVVVGIQGPNLEARVLEYPADSTCLGGGTVPASITRLVEVALENAQAVSMCVLESVGEQR